MLGAAIVGMGAWGRVLVESVRDGGAGIRFVAGSTGRPERAREWAAGHGIRVHADYAAVLADPEVGAVVLATPHREHAAGVIAAAQAGKHVFVEKPFTLDRAEAEAAVAACRAAGVVLALGHNRRFLPATEAMRGLLADGAIGTLLHVEGQVSGPGALGWRPGMWRADPAESPLGGMGAMGIHMLDMFIHLGGPIAEVAVRSGARVLTNGLDDTTAMLCGFAGGATGTFATLAATPRYWRVAVFGDRGLAEMSGPERLTYKPVAGEGWTRDFAAFDTERAELAEFAAACAGGAPYRLPVAEAVHGIAVFDAMREAAARGRTVPVA